MAENEDTPVQTTVEAVDSTVERAPNREERQNRPQQNNQSRNQNQGRNQNQNRQREQVRGQPKVQEDAETVQNAGFTEPQTETITVSTETPVTPEPVSTIAENTKKESKPVEPEKVETVFVPSISVNDIIRASIRGVPGQNGDGLVKVSIILRSLFTAPQARVKVATAYVHSILHFLKTVKSLPDLPTVPENMRAIAISKFSFENGVK